MNIVFEEDALRSTLVRISTMLLRIKFIATVLFSKSPVKNLIKINIDILENSKEKNMKRKSQ